MARGSRQHSSLMESALRLPHITSAVACHTGYKNAVGAASRTLRLGWIEANIVSPKVFVFSDNNDNREVLALDLRKRTWSPMAPFPREDLNYRSFYQVGDTVYVLAKRNLEDVNVVIFKYEMRRNIWTEIKEMEDFRNGFSRFSKSTVMVGEDLYVFDCPDDNDENQFIPDTEPILLKKYNFASGALSSTGLPLPFDQFGDLFAQFRDFSFMAIESNGFIYTTDCTDWSNLGADNLPVCLMFDPGTRAWTFCPDAPTFFHRAVKFENDIAIVGGINFSVLEEDDLSQDTDDYFDVVDIGAQGHSQGHRPRYHGLDPYGQQVWRLSKNSQAWTRLPSMSTGRYYPGAVVVEGSIHVFGGNDGRIALDSAEELDLTTGVWKPLPRMPHKMPRKCYAFLLSGTQKSP